MQTFKLSVLTNDGVHFEGEVESLTVRTITGDVTILARHIDFVTAVGIGKAVIQVSQNDRRTAACIGGLLSVINQEVKLLTQTFEFSDEIDEKRAEKTLEEARKVINSTTADAKSIDRAKIKIQRSLTRLDVKKNLK